MEIINIDFNLFPTTRYQGSKRKILPWLYESFKELEFHTVLDACGGSGSVSYLLKKMGKSVTYNDNLHFNFLIGKAIIENDNQILTDADINELQKKKPQIVYKNFIEQNFKNIYYLPKENKWLDKVINNISNMNHYQPDVLQYKKALAYYALFQSSLIKRPFNLFHRKNLEIRTKEVVRNFGNKTTWERTFNEYFTKFTKEVNNLVFSNGIPNLALNKSIFDIDSNGYDMVYIDPPYIRKEGSNESSNYFSCYHFLEGLSKYDDWKQLIDYESLNLRLKNNLNSNAFRKETIKESIEEIIFKFRYSKIVFSYKVGGIPSIKFIVNCMKKNGKIVHTRTKKYQYALNHQNGDSAKNREVLIIGI